MGDGTATVGAQGCSRGGAGARHPPNLSRDFLVASLIEVRTSRSGRPMTCGLAIEVGTPAP
eukprot:scaffold83193_cov51-Phaeocystis_antarctica.AAC.1